VSREKDMAVSILENLGGKENIISMTNCMTRLRVEVKDKSRVKKEGVNAVSGVIKLLDNGEGIQIVLGPGAAAKVAGELSKMVGMKLGDAREIKSAIDDKTAAVMIELVQAEGGIKVLSKEFVQKLYSLCKEHGLLFVIDEVQTGIGRCGSLFCFEQYDITPDIITLAKGLGNGVPIGAMLCKKEVATFEPGEHGSTFGGNLLATRAALEVLRIIEEENIIENVNKMGDYLKQKLLELKEQFDFMVDVRGLGLLIGVELSFPVKELVKELAISGLLTSSCGGGNVIRFAPPLIVQKSHIDKALEIFKDVVKRYADMGRA